MQEGGSISRGGKVYCLWPRERRLNTAGWTDPDAWHIQDEDRSEPPETVNTTRF